MIAPGQTVTLRDVQGYPLIRGTLRLDGGVWYLDTITGTLALVGEGHESAIAAAIVPTDADRALAVRALAADIERRTVLASVLCGVARTRGMASGYRHRHGETQFVERLASMGLIECVSGRGLGREWRLTDAGREVVAALIQRNAVCAVELRLGTAAFVWRNEMKGAA